MKWLFIIFALLNIAFGAYNLFLVDNLKIKKSSNNFDKSQIVQLNELDSVALKKLQDKVLVTPSDIKEIPSDISSIIDDSPTIIPNATKLCFKLGPFTKKIMNDIRFLLEKEYEQLSFGIETTSDITYYRIYIPPIKDKKMIKETLLTLSKNGLKDNYVMSIDGRKNAIALGVFKQRSAAEKVADKATSIGLPTTIEAISNDKDSLYQLMVIFNNNQELNLYETIVEEKGLISTKCENKS